VSVLENIKLDCVSYVDGNSVEKRRADDVTEVSLDDQPVTGVFSLYHVLHFALIYLIGLFVFNILLQLYFLYYIVTLKIVLTLSTS